MADSTYKYDFRDVQFTLFEHLQAQRLFELPAYGDFDRADIDLLMSEAVKFAENVLAPANEPGDREGCQFDNGAVRVPKAYHAAYKAQCEAGWMAMNSPPEFGGQGLPFCIGAAVGEAFVGANCSLSMLPGLTRAAADMLVTHGTPEMQKLYVRPLLTGKWQGTMCLTEPHAGTAVGMINTTATRRDGKYFLRGQKIFISGGDHDLVDNVIHIVLARCEGASPGTRGLSVFVVPKHLVNADDSLGAFNDVHCVGIEKKLGIHGSPTCAMSFGEQGNCQGFLIGKEEQGLELMFHMMNWARVGVGVQGVALGAAAYQFAVEYAKHRIQGSEVKNFKDPTAPLVPIIKHPDVRRMLLHMKALTDAGRALILHTAMCLDLVRASQDEAEREKLAGRVELLTPLCKAWCSDNGFKVADTALQTMGGHGYLKDYPVEQLVRDARIAAIYEGANGIQAIDLLGRKVGRKQGMLFMQLMSDIGQTLERLSSHPVLGASAGRLAERKQKLEQTTMSFGMAQMSGDMDFPLLSATAYLRMLANVVGGWLMLEQGETAHASLEKLQAQAGANTDQARAALCECNAEARFYDAKLKTAAFYMAHVLTENDGLAAGIDTADRSALDVCF